MIFKLSFSTSNFRFSEYLCKWLFDGRIHLKSSNGRFKCSIWSWHIVNNIFNSNPILCCNYDSCETNKLNHSDLTEGWVLFIHHRFWIKKSNVLPDTPNWNKRCKQTRCWVDWGELQALGCHDWLTSIAVPSHCISLWIWHWLAINSSRWLCHLWPRWQRDKSLSKWRNVDIHTHSHAVCKPFYYQTTELDSKSKDRPVESIYNQDGRSVN